MDMMPASALTPDVAAELPGMPYPTIERYIVLAARAFCESSPVWQEAVDVTANDRSLDLSGAVTGGEVVRLMPRGLFQAGQRIPASLRPVSDTLAYYEQYRRQLILTQTPADDAFTAVVQVRPEPGSDTVPDVVYADYRDALIAGALYRSYRMVNEAWANGEAAQMHMKLFDEAVNRSLSDTPEVVP